MHPRRTITKLGRRRHVSNNCGHACGSFKRIDGASRLMDIRGIRYCCGGQRTAACLRVVGSLVSQYVELAGKFKSLPAASAAAAAPPRIRDTSALIHRQRPPMDFDVVEGADNPWRETISWMVWSESSDNPNRQRAREPKREQGRRCMSWRHVVT